MPGGPNRRYRYSQLSHSQPPPINKPSRPSSRAPHPPLETAALIKRVLWRSKATMRRSAGWLENATGVWINLRRRATGRWAETDGARATTGPARRRRRGGTGYNNVAGHVAGTPPRACFSPELSPPVSFPPPWDRSGRAVSAVEARPCVHACVAGARAKLRRCPWRSDLVGLGRRIILWLRRRWVWGFEAEGLGSQQFGRFFSRRNEG
jgi:hypothetical protein